MIYQSHFIGSGTRKDPLRPAVFDGYPYCSLDVGSGECLVAADEAGIIDGIAIDERKARDLACDCLLGAVQPSLVRRVKEIWLGGLLHQESANPPPAPPPVDPSDNFTRNNENPIGGNWTKCPGSNHDFQILSNKLTGANFNNDAVIYWNAATGANDQFSEITVFAAGGTFYGPSVRTATSSYQCYGADAPGELIFKIVGTTFTSLASGSTNATTAGDVLRVEAEGSTIRWVKNGTTYRTVTDTTYTSGRWGVYQYSFDSSFSLWTGGDITAAAAAQPAIKRFGGIPGMTRNLNVW